MVYFICANFTITVAIGVILFFLGREQKKKIEQKLADLEKNLIECARKSERNKEWEQMVENLLGIRAEWEHKIEKFMGVRFEWERDIEEKLGVRSEWQRKQDLFRQMFRRFHDE